MPDKIASSRSTSTVIPDPSSPSPQQRDLEKDVVGCTDTETQRPPSTTPRLQTWNSPRSNLWRCLATFYSFVILGANDGAYGALIPYLETWYHVDYTIVSLIFLSPVVGYMSSALLNNHVHVVYGQRGVACIMSVSHVIAYTAICLHPPYPVLVVVFIVAGFGNGMGDSGWNAWIGDMANANEVLGFLHGFYGLGAAMSPLVATTLITQAGWRWYEFYYFMVGAAVIEVAVLVGCFWGATGEVYRAQHPQEPGEDDASDTTTPPEPELTSQATSPRGLLSKINPFGKRSHDTSPRRNKNKTLIAVKNRVTILSSLFLLAYVGVEVSLGGWTTTFMLRVRHGSAFGSGLTSTGFWLGIMVGRLVLGFVTGRLFQSEKHAVATYLGCSVVLELLFWLIPNFDSSAVMVGFLGFFLGPMFPAAVVALTKLLPKDLHVAAVGFAAAFGSSGACILPFVAGAIANAAGVKALQPVILAAVVLCLGVWLLIPKLPKQRMA